MTNTNKAAEEGGLEQQMVESLLDLMTNWNEVPRGEKAVQVFNSVVKLIEGYNYQAIAADRASRQVANKAEVDLSSLKRYYRSDTSMKHTRKSGGWVKFKDVRELLATPPATTGASTVLTYERIKEEMHAYFSYSGNSDNKFWAHVDDIVLFAQWVAAQAGQVAVPEQTLTNEGVLPAYSPADYLKSPEALSAFLEDFKDESDSAVLQSIIGIVLVALKNIDQASSAPSAVAVPLYQIQYVDEKGSSVWHDVTEDSYRAFVLTRRRIVYAAPSPAKESK